MRNKIKQIIATAIVISGVYSGMSYAADGIPVEGIRSYGNVVLLDGSQILASQKNTRNQPMSDRINAAYDTTRSWISSHGQNIANKTVLTTFDANDVNATDLPQVAKFKTLGSVAVKVGSVEEVNRLPSNIGVDVLLSSKASQNSAVTQQIASRSQDWPTTKVWVVPAVGEQFNTESINNVASLARTLPKGVSVPATLAYKVKQTNPDLATIPKGALDTDLRLQRQDNYIDVLGRR